MMKISPTLTSAKETFSKERGTQMSNEEFCILLMTLPAFKVANADDNFDDEERTLMSTLLLNLLREVYGDAVSEEQYENLVNAYLDDFHWITSNSVHEKNLDEALSELCSDVDGLKSTVVEMMNDVAAVSEGVSEEEQTVMQQITERL